MAYTVHHRYALCPMADLSYFAPSQTWRAIMDNEYDCRGGCDRSCRDTSDGFDRHRIHPSLRCRLALQVATVMVVVWGIPMAPSALLRIGRTIHVWCQIAQDDIHGIRHFIRRTLFLIQNLAGSPTRSVEWSELTNRRGFDSYSVRSLQ